MSTYVVEGSGVGMVISTGEETVIGRIAGLSSEIGRSETLISKEINDFIHNMIYFASLVSAPYNVFLRR